eukprot:TRINITY_DN937_c0_g2_i1.p1 TRINITY_DN937_c0_g2~~TRINITY_DN937_c0_g2_i1.p1  ORF type:complete len:68 (-),score=8.60 TRINITY_DN937_c0_g2_i1:291-494(-)
MLPYILKRYYFDLLTQKIFFNLVCLFSKKTLSSLMMRVSSKPANSGGSGIQVRRKFLVGKKFFGEYH